MSECGQSGKSPITGAFYSPGYLLLISILLGTPLHGVSVQGCAAHVSAGEALAL